MTIDAEQMELYCRYGGDLDALSRSEELVANADEKTWRHIDEIRQRMFIVQSGYASSDFQAEFESDLLCHVPNGRALDLLRNLVASDIKRSNGLR